METVKELIDRMFETQNPFSGFKVNPTEGVKLGTSAEKAANDRAAAAARETLGESNSPPPGKKE